MSPANHYRRWTADEKKRLRVLARKNTPTRVLAHLMGRSVDAIYKMANRLGISLMPMNQSPYSRRKK
jgi:hypothetical protein